MGVGGQRSTRVARHCDDTALIIGVQEARCCRARAFVPDHGIIHILAVRVAPPHRARAIALGHECVHIRSASGSEPLTQLLYTPAVATPSTPPHPTPTPYTPTPN